MAIKASSSQQIDALIADLGASRAVTRETAVARLTLLGARAVERLIAAAASASAVEARAGAWRTLEGIGDPRALDPALGALEADDPAVAAAAAGVARVHLRGARGARAVDRLATVLLDPARNEAVRLAALRALRDLPGAAIAPILASLGGDANAAIRAEAGLSSRAAPRGADDPAALVARAAGDALPDDPDALRHAVNLAGAAVPLASLKKVIDRVREREGAEAAAARDQWRLVRAAAHTALAHRGSRLALYDLRESIETAQGRLPVEFFGAIARIGDASCIEPIAAAHVRARDTWSRDHLARAFREIVARAGLTKRHAELRRVEKRWPGRVDLMANG